MYDVHGSFSTEPDQQDLATEAEETEVKGQVLDITADMEQEGRGQRKKIKTGCT